MDSLLAVVRTLGLIGTEPAQERPWGLWVDWHRTPEATLKCVVVRPGARLSLQRHRGRREVWRVVAGHGEDQGPSPPVRLEPGSTHVVEVGALHRLANTGLDPLVVVELQTGRCSEDDIERIADDYARASPARAP